MFAQFGEVSNEMHSIEATQSWKRHLLVSNYDRLQYDVSADLNRRRLRHDKHESANVLEKEKEDEFWEEYKLQQDKDEKHHLKKLKKQQKRIEEVYANPGISAQTVHGLMIDAGSTGSRMHIFEWEPRVLRSTEDIQQAVSGEKLSFPGTESRWTDRLRPGLGSFASITDDGQLRQAIKDYLNPLIEFAKAVLHAKQADFGKFPIYLRATAGMRTLEDSQRARIMDTVRSLFTDPSFNPFYFVSEQARVISGEEEAIFDWTGVNFLMGELLPNSLGSGTVVNPTRTHGALDLGGSSTQISFYEPNENIMANLFKVQIGQAKHWNVYAHSFLYYGMNDAISRFHSRLAAGKTAEERLVIGVYNPCLPGGSSIDIRTNIHVNSNGMETWDYSEVYPSGDGYFQATLLNNNSHGDFDQCMQLTKDLLHLDRNDWCDFAHRGDCSIDGTYQPPLPSNVEFIGFSNFHHVWQFLKLPERATVEQLHVATKAACSMTKDELKVFTNSGTSDDDDKDDMDDDELVTYCFRSTYVLQLLENGYGFKSNDTIHVIDVIEGQKVGWALGAMLYEINTMPWSYEQVENTNNWSVSNNKNNGNHHSTMMTTVIGLTVLGMFLSLIGMFVVRERGLRKYYNYQTVKDVTGYGASS